MTLEFYITIPISKERYLNSIPFYSRENLRPIIESFQKVLRNVNAALTVFRNY